MKLRNFWSLAGASMAAQWYWPPAVGALFDNQFLFHLALVQSRMSNVHGGQFRQDHEISETANPSEDVGINRTTRATTNICQRMLQGSRLSTCEHTL